MCMLIWTSTVHKLHKGPFRVLCIICFGAKMIKLSSEYSNYLEHDVFMTLKRQPIYTKFQLGFRSILVCNMAAFLVQSTMENLKS